MAKTRYNFTLSKDTIEKLNDEENKSQTIEKAIDFYYANKNKKEEKPIEIPNRQSFKIKEVKL